MKRQTDQSDLNLHDALVNKGWWLLKKYALLNAYHSAKIGWLKKWRLKRAIQIYVKALKIVPDSIAAKWALGKIYQALDDHNASLSWFEEALALEENNADICREASLAAMSCSYFKKALVLCDKAIDLKPEDAGLYCNRAIALMFLERDAEAIESVAFSLKLCPNDQITLHVRNVLHSVVDGVRSRPQSMEQI